MQLHEEEPRSRFWDKNFPTDILQNLGAWIKKWNLGEVTSELYYKQPALPVVTSLSLNLFKDFSPLKSIKNIGPSTYLFII
jgi:hypothetical protein